MGAAPYVYPFTTIKITDLEYLNILRQWLKIGKRP